MSRRRWGSRVEPVSTQVIPRDRHAMYFATLGVVASSIERLATEIRHLQRTEVLEAEEFFSPGQKGSSAMPHKRNPVLTENLTGLARLVRGYVMPALENVALWHERDISHSSVERMIGPDATVTLDFALARLAGVIDKLVVYPENMQKQPRPARRARAFAARAAGADPGGHDPRGRLSRWCSATPCRSGAARAISSRCSRPTRTCARHLTPKEIEAMFDLGYHLKHVDTIFSACSAPRGRDRPSISGAEWVLDPNVGRPCDRDCGWRPSWTCWRRHCSFALRSW